MLLRWLRRQRTPEESVLRLEIERCLEVFSRGAGLSEEQLVETLVARGTSSQTAEKLVALVPLAFGRILISHMGKATFPNEAVLETKRGMAKSIDLRREPIFTHALELGTTMYHQGPRHLFAPAASASAEVGCINQLLNDGGTIDGVGFSAPRFLRLTYEEWVRGD